MKQFKTESKRILDLMINSIYTNKEIFLRELISNASDAIDKRHFISLTDGEGAVDFKIELVPDKETRTLVVRDNGIGMNGEELEKNLGTIAQSGTLAFKREQANGDESVQNELIGQFGVGFYSAFMVAEKIEVLSRKLGEDNAYRWTSTGADGYSIESAEKAEVGTEIKLYLRKKDDDFDYDEFLQEYYLRSLVKKYSDYIRYPIVMEVEKSRPIEGAKDDEPKYEAYRETETLNGMTPIWKKSKSDVTDEEYAEFYKAKFHDVEAPLKTLRFAIEGAVNYTALLFVPSHAPYNYYNKDYQKGLQLYSNGVLITDKCDELLPDCFGFVRGIVDSSDLSLNISREMLQQNRQLRAIANGVGKKIAAELKKTLESDRDTYEKLFAEFGLTLKFGVYNNFGVKKDELKDLLLFHSSTQEKLTTLKEYVERMQADQKFIYYACGDSVEKISALAVTELLKEKGYEILYMPDNVDEFVVKTLMTYAEKEFKSAASADLGLDSDEKKEELEKTSAEHKEMLDELKSAIGDEVKEVKLSTRMKNNAVCLTVEGEISLEMEKVFKSMKNASPVPVLADKVLEINPEHKIFAKLVDLYKSGDKEKLGKYARVLFASAMLVEGMEIENPSEIAATLAELLS